MIAWVGVGTGDTHDRLAPHNGPSHVSEGKTEQTSTLHQANDRNGSGAAGHRSSKLVIDAHDC